MENHGFTLVEVLVVVR
ncbi:prepilin-type N-terminal cleavage/methylation domain-containing protein [Bradyrhizobium sp. I1.8.5]